MFGGDADKFSLYFPARRSGYYELMLHFLELLPVYLLDWKSYEHHALVVMVDLKKNERAVHILALSLGEIEVFSVRDLVNVQAWGIVLALR